MMASKVLLSLALVFAYVSVLSAQFYTPPSSSTVRVSIAKIDDMSPSMQLDASDYLKNAYGRHTSQGDICSDLRQQFMNKYTDYIWHVVVYKAYAVQSLKSIELMVGDDHYYLFATKK